MADRIERASRLFEDFSGHEATRIDELEVPDIDAVQMLVGEAEAIAYNTVRDGEKESYIHEFRKGSRPLVSASHDGKRLYLLGGAYRFTDRGIEDRTMPQIALVNPSRRKGKKMARRTAAQRAATRKLIAFNRSRRRRSNPRKRRYTMPRKRHSVRAHAVKAHSVKAYRVKRHMSNPRRRHHRRSNPIGMGGLFGMLVPGAVGAAGALGTDVLIGYLPLPPTLQMGLPRKLVQLVGIVGLGWLVGKFASRRMGEAVVAGGVTVVLYDLMKGYLVQSFPNIPLVPTAVVTVPSTATGAVAGLGWTSPAPILGDEHDYNYEGMGMDSYVSGMGDGSTIRAY